MAKAVHVRVTQKDIDEGVRRASGACPIAHACHRQGFVFVSIRDQRSTLGKATYENPPEVAQFIRAFDLGEPVRPFSFTLTD